MEGRLQDIWVKWISIQRSGIEAGEGREQGRKGREKRRAGGR
jgi:hypothetical protein